MQKTVALQPPAVRHDFLAGWWRHLVLWAVLVLRPTLILVYSPGLLVDDAYITYRYARNLVHGCGLVYNPGEHVEGITNLLWTLVLAIPNMDEAPNAAPLNCQPSDD